MYAYTHIDWPLPLIVKIELLGMWKIHYILTRNHDKIIKKKNYNYFIKFARKLGLAVDIVDVVIVVAVVVVVDCKSHEGVNVAPINAHTHCALRRFCFCFIQNEFIYLVSHIYVYSLHFSHIL